MSVRKFERYLTQQEIQNATSRLESLEIGERVFFTEDGDGCEDLDGHARIISTMVNGLYESDRSEFNRRYAVCRAMWIEVLAKDTAIVVGKQPGKGEQSSLLTLLHQSGRTFQMRAPTKSSDVSWFYRKVGEPPEKGWMPNPDDAPWWRH